jgi:hypothetical protein
VLVLVLVKALAKGQVKGQVKALGKALKWTLVFRNSSHRRRKRQAMPSQ